MPSTQAKRTRSERVASLVLKSSEWEGFLKRCSSGSSLLRALIVLLAVLAIVLIFRAWEPAFPYREGDVPQRDIMARVPFSLQDERQTQALRDQKRREALCYYRNDPTAIDRAVDELIALLRTVDCGVAFDAVSEQQLTALRELAGDREHSAPEELRSLWEQVCKLVHGEKLEPGGRFYNVLNDTIGPLREMGILTSLSHDSDQGSQRSIIVLPEEIVVDVARVRRSVISEELPQKLVQGVQQAYGNPDVVPAARVIGQYLVRHLPHSTLTYDRDRSEQARRRAEASVAEAVVSYYPSVSRLAVAGKPLSLDKEIPLLWAEHQAWVSTLSIAEKTLHLLAFLGMLVAVGSLCGWYIFNQGDRRLLVDLNPLTRLMATIVIACLLCRLAASIPLRSEVMPIILVSLALTIAFGRSVGVLLGICLSLVVTLGLANGIVEFVVLSAAACASAMLVGRIRTRTRLMYVGLVVGMVVATTNAGVQTVVGVLHAVRTDTFDGQVLGTAWPDLLSHLLVQSVQMGALAVLAGALMTGLLPLLERFYDVQTDLRLLELGDPTHPLLRELAQKAPGTYNHSINVAAIAEAAADAIGAHGLLTRVGAYFHDIGKMFKPEYFIENQKEGANSHMKLRPAMSTLVIIAHVKDGADLARKYRLPKRIVDFIEQHHGTTLVEYFYREATRHSAANPDNEPVSETAFRYPGPKPQTLEAAVLMLADSVESACRTLVEPTSSRIRSLVHDIAMKKLLDGQFDECGLTLQHLRVIEESLVKSLTGIYHGRIKYPEQVTA